jgi:hypothetical protein
MHILQACSKTKPSVALPSGRLLLLPPNERHHRRPPSRSHRFGSTPASRVEKKASWGAMRVRARPPHCCPVQTASWTATVSTRPRRRFLHNAGARPKPLPSSSPSYPNCVHAYAIPVLCRGEARAEPRLCGSAVQRRRHLPSMTTPVCPHLHRRRPPPRSHRAQPHPRPAPTSPLHVACRPLYRRINATPNDNPCWR